jgi:pyruvate dehydrogenase E2 component (dihydrolipoamide acetyltransferase)
VSIEITVPRLGWSMEEGTFAGWLKQNGDKVAIGEPLFAVESDKVTMDVESLDAGILQIARDAPEIGGPVRVGQCIGFLVAAIPATTPRARRIAKELGVDIAKLKGTGRNGRVRESDVRATPPPPAPPPTPILRRTIAKRMEESRQNTVPVTLTTRADATALAAAKTPEVSYTILVARIAAIALEKHPALGGPHIGIAVDTAHGLVVPVLRNVATTSLAVLAGQAKQLIAAAHERRLKPEDLSGGTFSITNLGGFGIDGFTPVINYPEIAVLGLGAVRKEVVARDNGDIGVRNQITLSLTFDHRVVDGAPAARFLQEIVRLIERC